MTSFQLINRSITILLWILFLASCAISSIESRQDNPRTKEQPFTQGNDRGFLECVIRQAGVLTGTVSFENNPVDGAFATVLYDGGASQATRIRQGNLSVPIIARNCANQLYPIGFQLIIGDWREYLKLTGTKLELVIQLPSQPVIPDSVPEHSLVLGKISGKISKDGKPISDFTEVQISIGGGIEQMVFTKSGIYSATTMGEITGSKETYLPVTIKIDASEITFIPTRNNYTKISFCIS